jgi:hypothetical protein
MALSFEIARHGRNKKAPAEAGAVSSEAGVRGQLTWVQVPSGLRQAVPRIVRGLPSI